MCHDASDTACRGQSGYLHNGCGLRTHKPGVQLRFLVTAEKTEKESKGQSCSWVCRSSPFRRTHSDVHVCAPSTAPSASSTELRGSIHQWQHHLWRLHSSTTWDHNLVYVIRLRASVLRHDYSTWNTEGPIHF